MEGDAIMPITLEVYDSSSGSWIDKTSNCVRLRHSLGAREIENIEFELIKDSVEVGQEVRIKRGGTTLFEGIIYEVNRRQRRGEPYSYQAKAFSYLILYDRHIVYQLYPVGTKAGEIIKDLASLVEGVDVSNVDDGDALLSPWEIENQKALDVMRSVARGVNYWLRMKPGKALYFKPKTESTPKATIDSSLNILSAECDEDRWRLKNRVIYVGADGQILADVSEGKGDLPVVVHDPFLTDPHEAERRAKIRLALNKEYGRQLKVEMHQADFENLNIDLGDTVTVNLPDLGLNNVNMFLVEIEYDPKNLRYRITLGGICEMIRQILEEEIGGDVAARFGRAMKLPEQTSTLAYSLDRIARIQADQKHVIYVNKPPLTLYNAQNVILNSNGEAELASGAIEGSFEAQVLPPSELFVNWIKSEWIAKKGEKTIPGSPEDWPSSLTSWKYRKKIPVNENAGQDLDHYQIKITVHYGSGTDSGSDIYLEGKCKEDFGDVRFADADGNLLPYEYETEGKVDGDHATYWVKIPSLPANGTTNIYIYYGNPDATYDGDPEQVFESYDDFSSETLNPQWTFESLGDGGSYSLTSHPGQIEITANPNTAWNSDGDFPLLYRSFPSGDFAVHAKVHIDPPATNYKGGALGVRVSSNGDYIMLRRLY
ncbi:MAG: DUF2341 domain-containing protein, partial [Thaumarchaeota archaeon]|nr:DUF2341 domain-containing protein [Nitrososphaerota archaeon]